MPLRPEHTRAGVRLMRYVLLATAVAFVGVGVALVFLLRSHETFIAEAQREHSRLFRQAQEALARQQEDAARATLLAVHEAHHVNLTRAVANLMWDGDIAPLMAAAQGVRIDGCLGLPAEPLPPRRRCWGEVGRRLAGLPALRALDARVGDAMRGTAVVKLKVFDLRGVTVYSSEPTQIGEYAGGNAGWRAASEGRAASELTHRDRFSAFGREMENRELISSHVPVRGGRDGAVVAVVQLYSDATSSVEQVRAASRQFAELSAGQQARADEAVRANQARLEARSGRFLLVAGGLMALTFATTLALARSGQRRIDRQSPAQPGMALPHPPSNP